MWLYDTLIWTIMGYRAEVWGWRERKEVEEIHERFIRWTRLENARLRGERGDQ